MTVDGSVEGGLDEPTELEPEQGSLRPRADEDRHARGDWEAGRRRGAAQGAPAGGRRPRRPGLGEADPHRRSTASGSPPLGTPELLEDLPHRRPSDPRGGVGRPRPPRPARTRRRATRRSLVDLDGGVTSLWLEVDRGHRPGDRARRRAARPRARWCSTRPPTARRPAAVARAFLDVLGDTTPARHQPRRAAPDATASRSPGSPATPACSAFVVDATTVHDRGASDVQELGRVDGRRRGVPARADRRRLRPSTRPPALVEFRYAATDEQFPTIAKLRAARRLWAGCSSSAAPTGAAAAPARGHQPPDDEQVRPLGEHAPHHRRGLRRRCRRRGRRHRAAVRQPARPPGRLRPPDRPQHLAPADRRVARRHGRRPGRRRVRRREAHRRPRRRRRGQLFGRLEEGADPVADLDGRGRRDRGASATARSPPASARSPG